MHQPAAHQLMMMLQARAGVLGGIDPFAQLVLDEAFVVVVVRPFHAFQVLGPLLGAAADFPGPVGIGDAGQARLEVALAKATRIWSRP